MTPTASPRVAAPPAADGPPRAAWAGIAVAVPLCLLALAYAALLIAYNGAALSSLLAAPTLEPRDYGLVALFAAVDIAAALAVWSALAALWRFARAARGRPSRATLLERAGLGLAALYFGAACANALLRGRLDPLGLGATLAPALLSLAALILLGRLKGPA